MNADELLRLPPILRVLQPHLESYNIRTILYQLYKPMKMALQVKNVRYQYIEVIIIERGPEFYIDVHNRESRPRPIGDLMDPNRNHKRFQFDPADPDFVDKVVDFLKKYQCLQ